MYYETETKKIQIQRIHNYNSGCSVSFKSNLHTRLEIETFTAKSISLS